MSVDPGREISRIRAFTLGQGPFIIAYAVVAGFSLWLRVAFPVFAIADAGHDDQLFVLQAYHLGAGQWLGVFNNLTLAKGPAYPAFILAAFLAHLPLKVAEQALYLCAAGLTAWLVSRMTRNRWLALCLFACLALNPVLWTADMARVLRDGIYLSLSLALVGLTALACLPRWDEGRSTRRRVLLWAAAGILGGIFWLTREEGLWLVPSLALLLAWVVLGHVIGARNDRMKAVMRGLLRVGAGCAVAGLGFAVVVGSVAAVNRKVYGVFATNEFRDPAFLGAYGALLRIKPDAWQRYIVVPKDVREKAYAVSAAARELRPVLDGEVGERWRAVGCQQTHIEPCNDMQSGWFLWALRDAVAAAGHYSSAPEAFAFYRRLAAEIDAACDDGRLACLPPRATMAPPFRPHYVADVLALVPQVLLRLVRLGDGNVGSPPSFGLPFNIDIFADLVGDIARAAPPATIGVAGNLTTKEKTPQVIVRDEGSASFAMSVEVRPDEAEAKTNGTTSGKLWAFYLTTDCLRPTCVLVVTTDAGERTVPISEFAQGRIGTAGELNMTLRRTFLRGGPDGVPRASAVLRQAQIRIARAIAAGYSTAGPWLALLALAGFLAALVWRPRDAGYADLAMIAFVTATAVAARVALLAYIDVTSIPGTASLQYLSPASPMLLVFIVLGLFLGYRAAGGAIASNRDRETMAVLDEPSAAATATADG